MSVHSEKWDTSRQWSSTFKVQVRVLTHPLLLNLYFPACLQKLVAGSAGQHTAPPLPTPSLHYPLVSAESSQTTATHTRHRQTGTVHWTLHWTTLRHSLSTPLKPMAFRLTALPHSQSIFLYLSFLLNSLPPFPSLSPIRGRIVATTEKVLSPSLSGRKQKQLVQLAPLSLPPPTPFYNGV